MIKLKEKEINREGAQRAGFADLSFLRDPLRALAVNFLDAHLALTR
jgi:hypothetical protein